MIKKLNKHKVSKNLFFIILSSLLMQEVFKVAHIGLLGSDIVGAPVSFIKDFATHFWK
jgi:hypothetical protein